MKIECTSNGILAAETYEMLFKGIHAFFSTIRVVSLECSSIQDTPWVYVYHIIMQDGRTLTQTLTFSVPPTIDPVQTFDVPRGLRLSEVVGHVLIRNACVRACVEASPFHLEVTL